MKKNRGMEKREGGGEEEERDVREQKRILATVIQSPSASLAGRSLNRPISIEGGF